MNIMTIYVAMLTLNPRGVGTEHKQQKEKNKHNCGLFRTRLAWHQLTVSHIIDVKSIQKTILVRKTQKKELPNNPPSHMFNSIKECLHICIYVYMKCIESVYKATI